VLSEIPFLGMLSLLAGSIIGISQRRLQLLLFLVSIAASETFVAIAGMLRGQMRGRASYAPFWLFLGLQVFLLSVLIHR
jgi:hypothetical protein